MLYGSNKLGAVVDAILSTFFVLERFGTGTTLWLACLFDLLAALGASALCGALAKLRAAAAVGPTSENGLPVALPG